jgi:hypothetical protein
MEPERDPEPREHGLPPPLKKWCASWDRPDRSARKLRRSIRTRSPKTCPHDAEGSTRLCFGQNTGLSDLRRRPLLVEDLAREDYPTPRPILATSVSSKAAPSTAARFGPSCLPTRGFPVGPLNRLLREECPGIPASTG